MWYRNAIFYSLDVKVFYDSDGDGTGDLQGVVSKLDYIQSLGCTCIWLLPFFPSPKLDNGYDVTDYYNVDPVLGSLGDFVQLVDEAGKRGIRVIIDLIINHTSIEHPWFKESESRRESRYRHFYIWDDDPEFEESMVKFKGAGDTIWAYSEKTASHYLHEYYPHQADLNLSNPDLLGEILKIMQFWITLGVSGFRIDAAHSVTTFIDTEDIDFMNLHTVFERMNDLVREKKPDTLLLGEADVKPEELGRYFISSSGKHRLHVLFNFLTNKLSFLSFATKKSEPLYRAINKVSGIGNSFWLNFVRHHDELNLGMLEEGERRVVQEAFGPDENMQVFGHGIRRRLPTMLGNDMRRIRLVYAVVFGLPGVPLLNYGDEIGMGDNLELKERESVRTPMQWSNSENAGFSYGPAEKLYRPVISDGEYGFERVNVTDQQNDPGSLLNYMSGLIRFRLQNPAIGEGQIRILNAESDSVAAWYFDNRGSRLMAAFNLSENEVVTGFNPAIEQVELKQVFGDSAYTDAPGFKSLRLNPYGFRWMQISEKK